MIFLMLCMILLEDFLACFSPLARISLRRSGVFPSCAGPFFFYNNEGGIMNNPIMPSKPQIVTPFSLDRIDVLIKADLKTNRIDVNPDRPLPVTQLIGLLLQAAHGILHALDEDMKAHLSIPIVGEKDVKKTRNENNQGNQ